MKQATNNRTVVREIQLKQATNNRTVVLRNTIETRQQILERQCSEIQLKQKTYLELAKDRKEMGAVE